MMCLSEAAAMVNGVLQGEDVSFTAVTTDSRALAPGELFVALKGDRFDAHDFLPEIAQRGAAGAIVSKATGTSMNLISVEDTLLALGKLGQGWRQKFSGSLIGVTGSNGKTTLKEMLSAILSLDGDTLSTIGNLNNQIGVPLTLLRLRKEHRFAVVEMGTSNPGEIAYLANLAQPTIGVVTNASAAHLLGLGSVAEVAQEKGAMFEALSAQGTAIINADDDYFSYWKKHCRAGRQISFGFSEQADVRANLDSVQLHVGQQPGDGVHQSFLVTHQQEACSLQIPLLGVHNVRNSLAAIAVCRELGIGWDQIRKGLALQKPTKGRLYSIAMQFGTLIDDSYNANPLSFMAGIDALCALPGEPWLVMGDMGELGEISPQQHQKVVDHAIAKGVQKIFVLGKEFSVAVKGLAKAQVFDSHEALVAALEQSLTSGTNLLIKGSRFMAMEKIVAQLQEGEKRACC